MHEQLVDDLELTLESSERADLYAIVLAEETCVARAQGSPMEDVIEHFEPVFALDLTKTLAREIVAAAAAGC